MCAIKAGDVSQHAVRATFLTDYAVSADEAQVRSIWKGIARVKR
jgi:hypothetical protein